MKDLTESEAAWLAGFYEGEGSITVRRSKYRQLAIQIWQQDPEILERILTLTGVGKVYGPYKNNSQFKTKAPMKPKWGYMVTGQRDVSAFVEAIRPWLSSRRLIQVEKCLDEFAEYRATLRYPNKGYRKPVAS